MASLCRRNVENTYFVLWLKEYNVWHTKWMINAKTLQPNQPCPLNLPSRAKRTFFTSASLYALSLSSDLLGLDTVGNPTSVVLQSFYEANQPIGDSQPRGDRF